MIYIPFRDENSLSAGGGFRFYRTFQIYMIYCEVRLLRRRRPFVFLSPTTSHAPCRLTKGFGTYIPNRDLRVSLQLYRQDTLFDSGTSCPGKRCGVDIDVLSDHLLYYDHESHRI